MADNKEVKQMKKFEAAYQLERATSNYLKNMILNRIHVICRIL